MLTRDDILNTTPAAQEVVRDFNALHYFAVVNGVRLYYLRWLGVPLIKMPTDLWTYQEIFFDFRPQLIIETGTAHGGSALYYYSLATMLGDMDVVSVDVSHDILNQTAAQVAAGSNGRLTYFNGSSIAPETLAYVRGRAAGKDRVMVILDSDHTAKHVYEELRLYSDLVSPGQYLIVEDTICDELAPIYDPESPLTNGPLAAVEKFLAGEPEGKWARDEWATRHMLTSNRGGCLRRVS